MIAPGAVHVTIMTAPDAAHREKYRSDSFEPELSLTRFTAPPSRRLSHSGHTAHSDARYGGVYSGYQMRGILGVTASSQLSPAMLSALERQSRHDFLSSVEDQK